GTEQALGLVGVEARLAHGIGEAVALLDEADQLLELGLAELALGREHDQPLALLALEGGESADQGQRDLALAQIGAELLAGLGRMAEEVDDVVGDLEGHAHGMAEAT